MEKGEVPAGESFTVFGAGETAVHAALFLAKAGKKVTLASPAAGFATDSNGMLQIELDLDLQKAGVKVQTNAAAPADSSAGTVVWAGDRTASKVMDDIVDDNRVITVGTRLRGGRLYEATQPGARKRTRREPKYAAGAAGARLARSSEVVWRK